MLELGQPLHAFDRGAAARADRRAPRASGRALQTLDGVERALDPDDLLITDDSGPIAPGRASWAGRPPRSARTDDRVLLEAAHCDPPAIARTARRHKLPSEAARRFERGVDPQLPRSPPSRAARLLVEYGGGDDRGRASPTSAPRRRPRRCACRWTCPTASPACLRAAARGRRVASRSAAASSRRRRRHGVVVATRRRGVPTSPTRPTWSRRSSGSTGYETIPSVLPAAPPAAGSPPPSCAAAPSRAPWPRPAASRCCRSRSSAPPPGTPSACRPTTPAAAPCAWPTRCRAERPALATTLLPGLLDALARNRSRGFTDLMLYEVEQVVLPAQEPGRDAGPGRGRPAVRRRVRADRGRAPGAARARRRGAHRRPGTARLVGPGAARPAGPTRSRPPGSSAAAAGVELRCGGRRSRRGTRAGVLRCGSATGSSGTRGSCTRRSSRRWTCRSGRARSSWTSTLCRCVTSAAAPAVSTYPPVAVDVSFDRPGGGAGGRADRSAGDRRRRPAGGRAAVRRLHRASRSRRAAGRWPSRCASAPRTGR